MRLKPDILLLEDDLDIQAAIKLVLEAEGYRLHCASNGKEALTFLASAKALPGLILLDLMMPEMNGYEFRSRQLQDPRISQIPAIVMSAELPDESLHQVSFTERIIKPLDLTAFIELIQRVI